MNVSKKSWHYSFYRAGQVGPLDHWKSSETVGDRGTSDICTYTRSMLLGVFVALIEIMIGSLILMCMVDPVVSLGFWLFTSNGFIAFYNSGTVVMGGFIWAIAAGIGTWYVKTETKFGKSIHIPVVIKDTVKESSTVNLIKTYFKAFKDKTCILININE